MAGQFGKEAGAALAFGILYFLMFIYMSFMYATKRYKWASRFTILYFHCLIRVASQACGVAFGVLVWRNTDVFVAYLILSAEGYFSLTIAAYYFLKHFEVGYFGFSALGQDPKDQGKGAWRQRSLEIWTFSPLFMPWRFWEKKRIMIVDSWLIPANAIIIAGGSLMASLQANNPPKTEKQIEQTKTTSKALRTTGQAIFFCLTVVWVLFLANTVRRLHQRGNVTARARAAIALFSVVAVMLCVRGIFGILQAAISSLSYISPSNYDSGGFTDRFVAIEYCLAVLPEFTAASTLNASYWPARREPEHSPDRALKDDREAYPLSKVSS